MWKILNQGDKVCVGDIVRYQSNSNSLLPQDQTYAVFKVDQHYFEIVEKPFEADQKPNEADQKPNEIVERPVEADQKPVEADQKPEKLQSLETPERKAVRFTDIGYNVQLERWVDN